MRYIILLLLSIIAVEASKITIDERMTDIYFGNGILTTEGEAEIGRYNLHYAILHDIYGGDKEAMKRKHGKEVKLAYNSSFLVPKLQLGNAYNNKQDN